MRVDCFCVLSFQLCNKPLYLLTSFLFPDSRYDLEIIERMTKEEKKTCDCTKIYGGIKCCKKKIMPLVLTILSYIIHESLGYELKD